MPLPFNYRGFRVEVPVSELQVLEGMSEAELACVDREASLQAFIESLRVALESRLTNAMVSVGVQSAEFNRRRIVYPTNVMPDAGIEEVIDEAIAALISGKDDNRRWVQRARSEDL